MKKNIYIQSLRNFSNNLHVGLFFLFFQYEKQNHFKFFVPLFSRKQRNLFTLVLFNSTVLEKLEITSI